MHRLLFERSLLVERQESLEKQRKPHYSENSYEILKSAFTIYTNGQMEPLSLYSPSNFVLQAARWP